MHVLAEVNGMPEVEGLPELVMASALVKDDKLGKVESAEERGDLAGIIRMDLVGKARRDRFGAGLNGVRGIRASDKGVFLCLTYDRG